MAANQEKKSRHSCENGWATLYPHEPRSMFTEPTMGRLLECLKNEDSFLFSKCDCELSCWVLTGRFITSPNPPAYPPDSSDGSCGAVIGSKTTYSA